MFIPDPELDFKPIPDPGVKRAPDTGSGFPTLPTRIAKPYPMVPIYDPDSAPEDPETQGVTFCQENSNRL
jgi:hypothetical protein